MNKKQMQKLINMQLGNMHKSADPRRRKIYTRNNFYYDIGEIIKDAIQGLKEFEDDNFQFIETKSMKRCKMEFQGVFDSFKLFADEYILYDVNYVVTSQQISSAYRNYCTEQGYIAFPDNIWGPLLMQKHMCKKTTVSISDSTGTKRVRGYKGIKLTYYDESDLE